MRRGPKPLQNFLSKQFSKK